MSYCSKLILLAAAVSIAHAQSFTGETRALWDGVKGYILKSAEKMPEENYSFKPSPDVRSFGQILGHVADSYYQFCSALHGETKKSDIEKTKTKKADLIAALQEATAYCDTAYKGITDAKIGEAVKFFGRDRTRGFVLSFNMSHTFEHYGNLITYLRIKGLVPPSSEPRR